MKIIITSIMLILFANFAIAQKKETQKGYIIIRPSLNSSSIALRTNGSTSSPNSRLGYGLGIEYMKPLAGGLLVTTGLHYNAFGYKDVRTNYMNIPIMLNYINKSGMIKLGAGVYGGVAASGKFKNSNDGWTKFKFGESATDNRSATDAGLLFNAGYNLFGFMLLESYFYVGLKNVTPKDRQKADEFMRVKSWSVNIGIPLNELMRK